MSLFATTKAGCLLLVLLDAVGTSAAIHPPSIEWQRQVSFYYGSSYYGLAALDSTPDGGFVLALRHEGSRTRFAIQRRDRIGNLVWERCLQSEWNGEPDSNLIAGTQDGGALLVLSAGAANVFEATCPLTRTSPAIGYDDYWLLRVDGNGNKLWDRTFGGTDDEVPAKIQQTADGGFLIAGGSASGTDGNKTALPRHHRRGISHAAGRPPPAAAGAARD